MDASLRSNTTIAEYTSNGTLTANSTGFSVSGHDGGEFNKNNYTYVTWGWKMGGTGSSNTDGSITSTVSANVAAGQSIVSYTGNGTSGATVGHGLSSAPELMIIKSRNTAGDDWAVYHEAMGNLGFMALNNTTAKTSSSVFWNSTSPTSTVLTLGNNTNVNRSSEPYIAYCFHSVEGYSKVGSYTGNGNANGIFLHTGFAPRYFMYKRTDAAHNWYIYDSERSTFNVLNEPLQANTSNTEGTDAWLDFTSNGIKIRTADNSLNLSGGDYIFIAFAENPFKYSNAR